MSSLRTIAARLHLGLIEPDDVPDLCSQLIQQGTDNPILRGLAGDRSATFLDRLALFTDALAQAEAPRFTSLLAQREVIYDEASDIFHGTVAPQIGAARLSRMAEQFGRPAILREFVTLAADWNATAHLRPTIEQAIITYARLVLAGSAP